MGSGGVPSKMGLRSLKVRERKWKKEKFRQNIDYVRKNLIQ